MHVGAVVHFLESLEDRYAVREDPICEQEGVKEVYGEEAQVCQAFQ